MVFAESPEPSLKGEGHMEKSSTDAEMSDAIILLPPASTEAADAVQLVCDSNLTNIPE
jgi:hypothetical protein